MANAENPMFSDRLGGAPHSKQSLRLWLKLLSCSMIVEKRLRARLDEDFKTTLPRFDVLAALERHAGGLKMSALSESLMVSNGNVTGVVTRLIEDGLVTRTVDQRRPRARHRAAHAQGPRCFPQDGGGPRAVDGWDVRRFVRQPDGDLDAAADPSAPLDRSASRRSHARLSLGA